MSLFPAYLSARKRRLEQPAPQELEPEPVPDDPDALPIFDLLPPQTSEQPPSEESLPRKEPLFHEEPRQVEEPPPLGRNVHTIGISDLTRLAIDNDGRLYWDGKPVEVARRILLSRRQVLGASLIAVFVVIGALGAAIQGAAAARDWACRLGWSSSYCGSGQPRNSSDIPA